MNIWHPFISLILILCIEITSSGLSSSVKGYIRTGAGLAKSEAKNRGKEAVGSITSNIKTSVNGAQDKIVGKVNEKVSGIVDGITDKVTGGIDNAVDTVVTAIANVIPPKVKSALQTVTKVLDTICSIGTVVSIAFPPAAIFFTALSTISGFISFFTGGSEPVPSPMEQMTNQISGQINDMRKEMSAGFDAIGDLIVDHSFTKDIMIKVDIMETYMTDMMDEPSRDVQRLFMLECEKHHPITLLQEIKGRLTYDSTNPLLRAMKADDGKTKDTFNKWNNTIQGLMIRLTMLQSFYYGLDKDEAAADRSSQHIYGIMMDAKEAVDKFITELKFVYWPDVVKKIVKDIQENYYKNNSLIATLITDKLMNLQTTDQFFVIAVEDIIKPEFVYCNGCKNEENTLSFPNKNGTNILVYRSQEAYKIDKEYQQDVPQELSDAFKKLDREISPDVIENVYTPRFNLTDCPTPEGIINGTNAGMVARIRFPINFVDSHPSYDNVAVDFTGELEQGPGFWKQIETESAKCTFFIGYK